MTVRCFNIVYDVSEDDLDNQDLIKNPIIMPKEVIVDIDFTDEYIKFDNDPDDFLGERIAEQTGWNVEEFDYEVIEE